MVGAHRLPLRFEPAPLLDEIREMESRSSWIDHWADGVSVRGTWGVLPLVSASGDHEGAESIHFGGRESARATGLLADAPRLRAVVESFHTRVLRARLMKLKAGAVIREHRDYGYYGDQRWSFERGFIRVHIPLLTSDGVSWRLDGKKLDMQPGEAWYVNVCRPHAVENRGETDRIHLVLELEVNDWLRGMFPPETWRERAWGAALRRFEAPLWKLVKPLWTLRRSLKT